MGTTRNTSTPIYALGNDLASRLAQAVCGDDHLTCSWPDCGCKTTKKKINAVALVVAETIGGIKERVEGAFTNHQEPKP